RRLALAVIGEPGVLSPPMPLVPWLVFPTSQIESGVHRLESLVDVGNILRIGIRARQFLDLEVFEPALRPFRFKGEIPFPRRAFADPGNFLTVDFELDDAVVGGDLVVVPFAAPFAAFLARQTAFPAFGVRPIGFAMGPPDAEEIAVAG